MGRILPFLILFSIIALAIYAAFHSYNLITNRSGSSGLSFPGINISGIFSRPTTAPSPSPQPALTPTPTPDPGIIPYLESNLLGSKSTCVMDYLGQDETDFYVWAICKNSSASISIPVAISTSLNSYRTPRAGNQYNSDLQKIFPPNILSQPIFTNPEIIDNLQKNLPG